MKILFSPVGSRDPISHNHDGSMLHVCRKYKPDYVYLYLSEEMKEYQSKDGRYTKAIDLINDKYKSNIKYKTVDGSNIEDVYRFDVYFDEFQEIFDEIIEKYPNAEILLNTSSGTPGMKSALQIIASLDEKGIYKPIQVESPLKRCDKGNRHMVEYDLEKEQTGNLDNSDEYVDRVKESPKINFISKIKKDILKKQVENYNYYAAFEIAKEIDDLSEELLSAIKEAKEKLSTDKTEFIELFKEKVDMSELEEINKKINILL